MEKNINGLVSQMNRITASFNAVKFLLAFISVLAFGSMIACYAMYMNRLKDFKDEIYVLDNGASFSAHAQDMGITKKDEIRDHVVRFHEYMFNVPPSADMIKDNLQKAFELADQSAYTYYNDIQEKGLYERFINTNSFQQIVVRDVDINTDVYPYQVILHADAFITRSSNITKYNLVTRCQVTNSIRSKKNLHGLVIEKFQVVEHSALGTKGR